MHVCGNSCGRKTAYPEKTHLSPLAITVPSHKLNEDHTRVALTRRERSTHCINLINLDGRLDLLRKKNCLFAF